MKKIVFTLALVALTFAANAQLVVSANIGGSMSSGSIENKLHQTLPTDSNATSNTILDKNTALTAGVKVGYKFGKCQVGLAGSFNMSTSVVQHLDPTFFPIFESGAPTYFKTTGEMTTKTNSFKVAPYFRYNIIEAGDVALFAELNVFYAKSMNPVVNAQVCYTMNPPMMDPTVILDTAFVFPRPDVSTSLGVSVTPGLSWQLSKNCGVDLYLDFLSLAYSTTTRVKKDLVFAEGFSPYSVTSLNPEDLDDYSTTTTTTTSQFGGLISGTPLLADLSEHNWVRVGFNFTF